MPAIKTSSPAPPDTSSLPPASKMVSLPLPPERVFAALLPTIVSLPFVPKRFSILTSVSLLAALPELPPLVEPVARLTLILLLKAEKSTVSEPEPPS